jgi:hypothetical protein
VRKLAAVRETLLQDIRALLLDPVDLRGLPFLAATAAPNGRRRNLFQQTARAIFFWMS